MSAGYGTRYRRQAQQLQKGDIVLAYLSGCGYVGVGKVVAEAIPARDFRFEDKRLSELDLKAPEIMHDHEDDEKCEYVIGIKWEKSKDRHEGLRKPGLFFARATRVSFGNSENIEQVRTLNCIEAEWNLSFNDLLKED